MTANPRMRSPSLQHNSLPIPRINSVRRYTLSFETFRHSTHPAAHQVATIQDPETDDRSVTSDETVIPW